MPLDQLLSKFAGSSGEQSPLAAFFSSPGTQGALGGAASGAAVSLLMNKKARKKLGKSAAKFGGVAAIAGVGYLAYRTWQNRNTGGAQASPPPPVPANLEMAAEQVPVAGMLQMKMILAMIAAASADGTIDHREMDALLTAIETAPIDPAGKSQLTAALNDPPSVEDIAGLVDNPEEASEVYGAALTAIEVDTPAEHLFLRRLSGALQLDPGLVATLHETVAA